MNNKCHTKEATNAQYLYLAGEVLRKYCSELRSLRDTALLLMYNA